MPRQSKHKALGPQGVRLKQPKLTQTRMRALPQGHSKPAKPGAPSRQTRVRRLNPKQTKVSRRGPGYGK